MRQYCWSWQDKSKIMYLILGATKLQQPLQVLLEPVFIDLRNFQVRYRMPARGTNSSRSIFWLARSIFTKIQWLSHFFKDFTWLPAPQVPKEDFYLIRSPAVLLREMQDVVKDEWKRTRLWPIRLKTEGTNVLLV